MIDHVIIDAISVSMAPAPAAMSKNHIASPLDKFPSLRGRRTAWYRHMDTVIVEVHAGGLTGIGLTQGGRACRDLIVDHLAPLLIGRDATATDEMWDMCHRATLLYGPTGIAGMARSAIDLALWDVTARAHGKPVFEMLGGTAHRVPLYASGNDIEWHRESGFAASKIAMQTGPWDDDGLARAVDQVRRARRRAGPDHGLMADAWMGWTPAFAESACAAMAAEGFGWIEEPLAPGSAGHDGAIRTISRHLPVAAGEHSYDVDELTRLADAGVGIVQPDIAWAGGITAGTRYARMARMKGIELCPHLGASPWAIHLVTAFPDVCRRAEWYISTRPGQSFSRDSELIVGVVYPHRGSVTLSQRPGFGLELDRKTLRATQIGETSVVSEASW